MKPDSDISVWAPPTTDGWDAEAEYRIEVDLEAAYIRLLNALLERFSESFPTEPQGLPLLSAETFFKPFVDFGSEMYDTYARELVHLPLEFNAFKYLLSNDLPEFIAKGTAPWDEPDRGQWQNALMEAWTRFYHPQQRRFEKQLIEIATALQGPVSQYRGRFLEWLAKHLFRRVRHWCLEWKKRHPGKTSRRSEPELQASPAVGVARRATVDEFLVRCSRELGRTFARKDIWMAAGHRTSRQFQYWQAGEDV
jgi:hypothetical protein